MKCDTHEFYCMKCGNRGIPLSRNRGHQHGRFHRKKIFCLYCQQEVNHIECKNPEDVKEFQENFEKGVYEDEANESVSYVRNTWIG